MPQDSVHVRHSLHRAVFTVLLTVFCHDYSSSSVQAWMYNHSTHPGRDWSSARRWCQEHFTDMLAIQNQAEVAYLNQMLPFNAQYYWIGIRKRGEVWTWVGTNKSLTNEAANWARGEPNNKGREQQDCVEIYIKRTKDTAKWNDESCFKTKGSVCYTASCSSQSCSVHGECVESIGSFTCHCQPGFQGPRCEDAVACASVVGPEQGSVHCNHSYGAFHFNSTCQFSCARGYRLLGAQTVLCHASGLWDHPAPLCQVERCAALLSAPSGGSMNCSHPIAMNSYSSTCEFRCDEGFDLTGPSRIQCDHTGRWTGQVSTCTVVRCSPLLSPALGHMTCDHALDSFSFNSTCRFDCNHGYSLSGDHTLTCLPSGQWSSSTPSCEVVRCNPLKAPLHASIHCLDPVEEFSYGSTCSLECEEGFLLSGSNSSHCSSQGSWSHAPPACQAQRCPSLAPPPHGSASCSHPHAPFSFGSQCVFSCEEGFQLSSSAHTNCTSLGRWSRGVPLCQAVACASVVGPEQGSVHCNHSYGAFHFNSTCQFSCARGYRLLGAQTVLCRASGLWDHPAPLCPVERCAALLSAPSGGSMNCSHPIAMNSYSSTCEFRCDEGFDLTGPSRIQCDPTGQWTGQVSTCTVVRCNPLKAPLHASIHCLDPVEEFSYGSTCSLECEEGFYLSGSNSSHCSSQGSWSHAPPACQAQRCPSLAPPPHGSASCSHPHAPFSFGSQCVFSCEEGFQLSSSAHTDCTSLGRWSRGAPLCQARRCPLLESAPHHSGMQCSHPYANFSYGSHCQVSCTEGYRLTGAPTMHCNTSGLWSEDKPTCQVVRCEALRRPPLPLSMNCSHPHGNFSFRSQCVLSCEEGFSLNGSELLSCSSDGLWSQHLPSCTEEVMSVGTGMLMYAGVGAASAAGVLLLAGLALLVAERIRKTTGRHAFNDSLWEEKENPVFEAGE